MTDVQLLTSIRARAASRIGNALFVKILDQLMVEARESILEEPVVQRLIPLCQIYSVKLDEFDRNQVATPRPKLMTPTRQKRLQAVGFGVENPKG